MARILKFLPFYVVLLFAMFGTFQSGQAEERRKSSYITINNPTRHSLVIELKCNWNGKRFEVLQRYGLSGKSSIKVKIPNSSKCQIWPIF